MDYAPRPWKSQLHLLLLQPTHTSTPFCRDREPQYHPSITVWLYSPSEDTQIHNREASRGPKQVYRSGYSYQKAGVIGVNLTMEKCAMTLKNGSKDIPASQPATSQKVPRQRMCKILVVGATGFLGSKIQRQLELDPTVTLRAMSRRGAPANASTTVEWVRGDLMDPASLDSALQDIDVVITSANGYMKETLEADFQGNKNLIDAAVRAGVKRFVFLSIVGCEHAQPVPHFHAKKVAEDLIKASGLSYVIVRAPAFLDQSTDYIADGVKAGRFYAVGDKITKWSYVLTADLADALAKAATYCGEEIANQTIDIGWRDGPKSQGEIAELISRAPGKPLRVWVMPWMVFSVLVRLVKPFSELGYDLIQMFLFFRTGKFVADTSKQEQFFGPAPTAKEAVNKWATANKLSN